MGRVPNSCVPLDTISLVCSSEAVDYATRPPSFELDPTDWVGHRVLARRDGYFLPGAIRVRAARPTYNSEIPRSLKKTLSF